jgi:hypothetical protein
MQAQGQKRLAQRQGDLNKAIQLHRKAISPDSIYAKAMDQSGIIYSLKLQALRFNHPDSRPLISAN